MGKKREGKSNLRVKRERRKGKKGGECGLQENREGKGLENLHDGKGDRRKGGLWKGKIRERKKKGREI